MDRKLAKIILPVGRVVFSFVIPVLCVLAIRKLIAPHLNEPVGIWSGIGFMYLSMIMLGIAAFSVSSKIERGIVVVIATVLGATAFGKPYDSWDYYGSCWILGAWYIPILVKLGAPFDRMEKELEQQETQRERT